MGRYSIKELEQLSGIKAHTIRMWEKRYALIEPQRTQTNIRFYSDNDLKKLINVSLLNANGFKISKIAAMHEREITEKVLELSLHKDDHALHINQLVTAMVQLDEEQFESTLSGFFLRYNFEQTMTEIVYPFLEKTGVLWQTHNISPAQEHFISNLIRQKIIVGIDGLPLQSDKDRVAILFLPENELHEIGLLLSNYILKKRGFRTIYLGQAVPYTDLQMVYELYKPQIMVTVITTAIDGSVGDYLKKLSKDYPCRKILITGPQARQLKPSDYPRGTAYFANVDEFISLINSV